MQSSTQNRSSININQRGSIRILYCINYRWLIGSIQEKVSSMMHKSFLIFLYLKTYSSKGNEHDKYSHNK